MKLNYSRLGDYINEVDVRNTDLAITNLLGVSMEKTFIPSVANITGVDLSIYKVLRKNQLACKLMSVGRDEKLPVDIYKEDSPAIVSSAYYVFEPKNEEELLPDFLYMWLCRPENDRYIGFISGGDVRGGISWETFCNIPMKVPDINIQREIAKEYNTIVNRIKLNERICKNLEETAQVLYGKKFLKNNSLTTIEKKLDDLCALITDGKHGDCEDELNSGYYFLSAKDLRDNTLVFEGARQITKLDFEETHRRTNLTPGDICMVNTGATIGRMSIAPNNNLTKKSTFQKSVAVIKPRQNVVTSYYLYCLLKDNIKQIKDLGSGTSQDNLTLGDLKNYKISYPGYKIIFEFEDEVKILFELQYSKNIENTILKKLQNLLLSKLATIEN